MSTAAQVLRQAESLKASLVENGRGGGESGRSPGGPGESGKFSSESGKGVWDVWVTRQRLEDVYKRLLLMDLEYALDKKVEQDLWNHAFKNQITALQTQAKDKHNPKKGEVQANLSLFLETASGFYLQFLQLICSTFKLDLPFRRKSSAFGVMKEKTQIRAKITPPKKSSCLYICQYCLVHLGDIARYRQQTDQAQTYYRHAVNLSPQNGQPYNQLAILEVNRNNKLSSVFYYVRSLAVRHPFPVAATNLEKFYSKLIKDTCDFKGKMAQNEFVNAFLQFQALLHLAADFERAAYLCSRILSCLPSHLSAGTFSSSVLVQCVAITIFTLNHVRHVPSGGEATPSLKALEEEEEEERGKGESKVEVLLSPDEEQSLNIILGFTASVLELLVQHTPSVPSKARESPTLPALQVLLGWLQHASDIIVMRPFAASNIWGHLAKLLNLLQQFEEGKTSPDLTKYEEMPLPEDTDLRCFQPIEKAHSNFSFSRLPVDGLSPGLEDLLRCSRLVGQGNAIANEFPQLKMTAIQQHDPPRINFSGPLVMKGLDGLSASQERRSKQNVAMQAIMKHGHAGSSETGSGGEGSASPKYLLGTATSEPQFMKHSAPGGSNSTRLQSSPHLSPRFPRRGQSPNARGASPMPPRVPSPQPQLSPPLQATRKGGGGSPVPPPKHQISLQTSAPPFPPSSSPASPPLRPQAYSQYQGHGHPGQGQGFQGQNHLESGLQQKGGAAGQYTPYNVSYPALAENRFKSSAGMGVASPPPGVAVDASRMQQAYSSSEGSGVAPNRHPTTTNHARNQEMLSALRLASQITHPQSAPESSYPPPPEHPHPRPSLQRPPMMPSPRGGVVTGMYPPPRPFRPGIPVTQRPRPPPGEVPLHAYPPSLRPRLVHEMGPSSRQRPPAPIPMPGPHPRGMGPYPGMVPPFLPEDGPGRVDGMCGYQALSPLTIQPPKSSPPDTRLCTSFQGHAEGTPKPEKQDGFIPEVSHEVEPVLVGPRVAMPMSQPGGEYSLFASSSPWSMPLNAGADPKSMTSSPFSSKDSSMRNSPVVGFDPPGPGHYDNAVARNKGPQPDGWLPPGQGYDDPKMRGQGQQMVNMQQAMWTEPVPMTPLQRLLEQQRIQRQTDPH